LAASDVDKPLKLWPQKGRKNREGQGLNLKALNGFLNSKHLFDPLFPGSFRLYRVLIVKIKSVDGPLDLNLENLATEKAEKTERAGFKSLNPRLLFGFKP
jgi:hypothetical protein